MMTLVCMTASAQFGGFGGFGGGGGNPWVDSEAPVSEDFKPALSNQGNKQYPMVNSARQVRAQISAPDAKKVERDCCRYDRKDNMLCASECHLK